MDTSELDRIIEGLGDLGENVRSAVTRAVGDVAHRQYASGQGPDGAAWPLTKDGRIALTSLTSQITFEATSSGVRASGPQVLEYHQETRPVFPTGGSLPGPWLDAAESATADVLRELEAS